MNNEIINLLEEKEKCSACGACLAVCPKQAITMSCDESGFLYPSIDSYKCVGCKKCLQICTYRTEPELNDVIDAYAAITTNENAKKNRASGGVFGSLALNFIKNGYASGAVFDHNGRNREVFHLVSDDFDDVKLMQGSKYVQSSAWKSYDQIKELLKQGKNVLFSGTPCQVDAIKRVTGDPDNLYTIDIICHGIPSMQMLNEYLDLFSYKIFAQIDYVVFRDNTVKEPFHARIYAHKQNKAKEFVLHSELLSFYKLFLSGTIYRENCYSCQYACEKRCGDLTIGDYWGIGKYHSDETNEKDYWSCVLVNTQKGKALLDQYGSGIKLISSKLDWIKDKNEQLREPFSRPENRKLLFSLYKKYGYQGIEDYFVKKRNGRLKYFRQIWNEILRNSKYTKKVLINEDKQN